MRLAILAALAAFTAACNDSQPVATGPTSNEAANAERIAAMPEGQRNAVFIRAIRDAGLGCQHVEASQRAGSYEEYPVWNAECTGGGRWTIVITPSGAQIIDADEARLAMDAERNQAAR